MNKLKQQLSIGFSVFVFGCLVIIFRAAPSDFSSETGSDTATSSQRFLSQENGESGKADPARPKNDDKEFEPLFVDWPQPKLVLFITGRQHGYIEPCGCTGLDTQKGGMLRQHVLMKSLQQKNWPIVSLDLGNQIRRFGAQPILKLGKSYEGLRQVMNYDVIGFGPEDLKIPSVELIMAMLNSQGSSADNPFMCANMVLADDDSMLETHRVIERAGKRIGVTMVLGDEHIEKLATVDPDEKRFISVDRGLRIVTPKLVDANCDLMVMLAYTEIEVCRDLAKKFPQYDIIVTAGGDGEPLMFPDEVRNGNRITYIPQVGVKGMHVGVFGLFDDPAQPLRYQRVPLDHRFKDDRTPEMKKVFKDYQVALSNMTFKQLGIAPVPHPSGRKFVGSESCADCHDDEFDIWKNGNDGEGGPHFRATTDLTEPGERTWVQRHHDPECLSCHVVGWNPQEFFPYDSGYLKLTDVKLHANGCENCHGPGSNHVAAENGDIDVTEEQLEQFQKEMYVSLKEAKSTMCMSCHDLDNSPDFHEPGAFDEYWDIIKH